MNTRHQTPESISREFLIRFTNWRRERMLDRIDAKYRTEAQPPPHGSAVPEAFGYVHYKAFMYLQLGPARYRKTDFFNCPPRDWTKSRFRAVKSGCEQILMWRGLSPERPLRDIGIEGFYALLHLFHFKLQSQAALDGAPGMILDKMEMEHVVDSRKITLYNEVKSPGTQW